MKPEYLEQLTEQVTEHSHVTGDNQLHRDEWHSQNRPYVWLKEPVSYECGEMKSLIVSRDCRVTIEVFTDVGHGFHCLFVNGEYQFIFKDDRVFNHDGETYMVVNGPSYGVGEYAAIFKLMEKR